jgi:ubiquinone/menaquinone biosynthesis C-methylase UbiE
MGIESSNDPQEFVDFEHNGWEAVSRGYEQHFSGLTSQSADVVLDAAEVGSNSQVLDVCCGPGMIASAAAARGARTTGIDFSAAVVKIATTNVPEAEFHEGDVQSLPYADSSFDAVVCGFGIIHVPDPQQALSEMYRVLKPAGRIAVSVWEPPAPNNGFGLLFGSIKANADMDVDLPHGPDFFQFSDSAKLTNALLEIGFSEPSISTIAQTWEFDDAHGLLAGIMEGAVRARGLIEAQTAAVQQAISDAVVAGMDGYSSADGIYRVPMPALIGSAVK